MRFAIAVSIFMALQVLAIADEVPLKDAGVVDARSDAVMRFEPTSGGPLQEGYVTLSWNTIAGAVEYLVQGDAGQPIYRGPFPQAFVSGLADGRYEFHVYALDARGDVIASSQEPAEVLVQHWPLLLAISLFVCGFVVFLAIVTVIATGSWVSEPPASGVDVL